MSPRVFLSRIRGFFGGERRDVELSEEIQSHLHMLAQEQLREGTPAAEALASARRQFGGVEQMKEAYRDQRSLPFMDALSQDLKFAFRQLRRNPGFAVAAVLTLALGIGANAAMFSVVRGVLLRPLVNRDESRLVYIRQSAPGIGAENMTFSVPEIHDLRDRLKTISSLGEFSTITFTMVGLGEPRQVLAGVVDGRYFEIMGLRPVLRRLLNSSDDGPSAAGAAVLTHRFWTNVLHADPSVVGQTIRLGVRSATIVGIVEPSVPYPVQTELIANVVTSPHHLGATMVTGREHRMTEVFGRLAPGADLAAARVELQSIHRTIVQEHREAYPANADFRINAVRLRDQITGRAWTVLLVLFAASGLIFLIACANVANLILARTVRRQGELAVRAALGASARTLRRTLVAESVVLCGIGAAIGVAVAGPAVQVFARYAARFSVRALDLTLDSSLVWVAAGLALLAAVVLGFVPRLPSADASTGLTSRSARGASASNRRLRVFVIAQIAASFVLLAGAGMLLRTLWTLQRARPGFEIQHVLAVDVPVTAYGRTPEQIRGFYQEVQRRLASLPGVERVAFGGSVPWRDVGRGGRGMTFAVEGAKAMNAAEGARARYRQVSPGYFAALGVPLIAGRDFTEADRDAKEPVVIISASIADQLLPGSDPVNRRLTWTDGMLKFVGIGPEPRRVIGVVADVDDEHIDPTSMMTIYHPSIGGGRLFVRASTDPYALVPTITRTVRNLATDQPVEHATTLEDVRTEVLAPDRLNTVVFGGFAAVALGISIVGVAGVLAFSVSGRTREFGIRLAVGSPPHRLLAAVVLEGVAMAAGGIAVGALGGFAVARIAGSYVPGLQMPGVLPVAVSGALLVVATIIASLAPAWRASRVDPMIALRSE